MGVREPERTRETKKGRGVQNKRGDRQKHGFDTSKTLGGEKGGAETTGGEERKVGQKSNTEYGAREEKTVESLGKNGPTRDPTVLD